MRVVVVGATGHIGSYLVPALVRGGHDVVALTRGRSRPYHDDEAWTAVERAVVDRDAADADGTFAATLRSLQPDAVVDLVCFEPDAASALVDGLAGHVDRLLVCGTIWVHGPTLAAPTRESDPRRPYGDYGVKKDRIEQIVLGADVPSVVLHPGHISGPGWPVITPVGNLDERVWQHLATGTELPVPLDGVGMLCHVHAADVAQAFERALTAPSAVGSAFHVVADQAVSSRGLADAIAARFDREAVLRPVDWPEFEAWAGAEHAAASREHLQRSHVMSIEQAREVLGYRPAHSAAEAVWSAVDSMLRRGVLTV